MARYEDKLDYEILISDEIKRYRVLKIILQPLVENAIYHGIKTKSGRGKIVIRGFKDDNGLRLIVEDDGVGLPEDKLIQLREDMRFTRQTGRERGYGLFNVNERIKLSHGPEYGISINSVPGQGTVVEVRLPLVNT